MDNIPGMVAKVQIIDTHYLGMVDRARSHFESLFRGADWKFLGALIEPNSYSQAFNASPDEPETWVGEFYGLIELHDPKDE